MVEFKQFARIAIVGAVFAGSVLSHLGLLGVRPVQAAPVLRRYRVVEVSPAGFLFASHINNAGTVVGTKDVLAGGDVHSQVFTWASGKLRRVGVPLEFPTSDAVSPSINDAGVIVATILRSNPGFWEQPFVARPKGSLVSWTPLPITIEQGSAFNHAYGINAHSEVVGYESDENAQSHPVVWTPVGQKYVDRALPTSYFSPEARAIDEDGRVAGEEFPYQVNHLVLWTPRHKAVLLDKSSRSSEVTAMAETQAHAGLDTSTVVGDTTPVTSGLYAATAWVVTLSKNEAVRRLAPRLLGHLSGHKENSSQAYGINENGWIVGSSDEKTGCPDNCRTLYSDGFLWRSGHLWRLDSLLTVSDRARWHVTKAIDINNSGQVLAIAVQDNLEYTVVLKPVS